ncbi:MAG TPA: glycosyltransferase family 39 protein [Aggregatilineales bacterium]|nr:glycosyltransferase family 39 protein [Aggregatilineales bacterium]
MTTESAATSYIGPRRSVRNLAEVMLLCLILLLAAHLRLTNVADNPGWYTDEATHVDIANHRLEGRTQYMLITDSTLLFARLPLFHILLAGFYQLNANPDHMDALRTLTALLGVGSVGLLYAAVRPSGGRALALLAALMLAMFPQAVLYSRFGFSYNLLTPFILLMLLGLERYLAGKHPAWLGLAAVMLGLCLVTEVWSLALLLPFILSAAYRPRHLLWALPCAALPLLIYALSMLASAPEAFRYDLSFTLSRLGAGRSLAEQWAILLNNYQVLLDNGFWILAGVIGLFTLRPGRLRWLALLCFTLPLISIGRSNALYSLSAYYMIPLLPLVALGVARLIRYGGTALMQAAREFVPLPPRLQPVAAWVVAGGMLLFLVGAPLVASLESTLTFVQQGYVTDIDAFLMDPAEARRVAMFINSRVSANDVVVASPVVGWQFEGNPVDFQMVVAAADRVATPHLPADLPPARLAFDPDYRLARFVVMDDLWRNWGVVHIPGLSQMVEEVQSNWPLVYSEGQFNIYENPF